MTNTTYNGWKNYETWNVALYIQNEYPLYKAAVSYSEYQLDREVPCCYEAFRQLHLDLLGTSTPDGVSYTDPRLCHAELNELLNDLS